MIYAIYKDDGPLGFCGQAMSITSSWERLYRLKSYDDFRAFRDMIEAVKSRKNPRIIAWFDDAEELGEVFDWEQKREAGKGEE